MEAARPPTAPWYRFYVNLDVSSDVDFEALIRKRERGDQLPRQALASRDRAGAAADGEDQDDRDSVSGDGAEASDEEDENDETGADVPADVDLPDLPPAPRDRHGRYDLIARLTERYGGGDLVRAAHVDDSEPEDAMEVAEDGTRRRKRDFGDYYETDDSFIDDEETVADVTAKVASKRVTTRDGGFFVATEDFEVVGDAGLDAAERRSKPKTKRARSPKPRPAAGDDDAAAAGTTGASGTAAAGTTAAGTAPVPPAAAAAEGKAAAAPRKSRGKKPATADGAAAADGEAANRGGASSTAGGSKKTPKSLKKVSSTGGGAAAAAGAAAASPAAAVKEEAANDTKMLDVPWEPSPVARSALLTFETAYNAWLASNEAGVVPTAFPRAMENELRHADNVAMDEHPEAAKSHQYFESIGELIRLPKATAVANVLRLRRRAALLAARHAAEVAERAFTTQTTARVRKRQQELAASPPPPPPPPSQDGKDPPPLFLFDMELRGLLLSAVLALDDLVKAKNASVASMEDVDRRGAAPADLEITNTNKARGLKFAEWVQLWPASMRVDVPMLRKMVQLERSRIKNLGKKKQTKAEEAAAAAAAAAAGGTAGGAAAAAAPPQGLARMPSAGASAAGDANSGEESVEEVEDPAPAAAGAGKRKRKSAGAAAGASAAAKPRGRKKKAQKDQGKEPSKAKANTPTPGQPWGGPKGSRYDMVPAFDPADFPSEGEDESGSGGEEEEASGDDV